MRQRHVAVLLPKYTDESGLGRRGGEQPVEPRVVDRERVDVERADVAHVAVQRHRNHFVEIVTMLPAATAGCGRDVTHQRVGRFAHVTARFLVEPGRDREDRVGHVRVPLDALEMQVEEADVVVVREGVHDEDAEVRDRGRATRHLVASLTPLLHTPPSWPPPTVRSSAGTDRRSARRAELGGVIVSPGPQADHRPAQSQENLWKMAFRVDTTRGPHREFLGAFAVSPGEIPLPALALQARDGASCAGTPATPPAGPLPGPPALAKGAPSINHDPAGAPAARLQRCGPGAGHPGTDPGTARG